MPMRMRSGWVVALTVAGIVGIAARVGAAPENGPTNGTANAPAASPPRTIVFPSTPTPAPGAATAIQPNTALAQAQINAGPLQGPLSPPAVAQNRCSCPVRRVVRHRRTVRRAVPVPVVAVLPPPVRVIPVVPVYAYPPTVIYRPVVPVYGFRPFFRPYPYRPYLYRPFFYRGYGRFY